ncbi:uncharacterized protein LOC132742052 isoform X2 [Ruditapes philippinarum]|nr:uncharacterized protein LOC132742052 isoform X2 [Ruditapes philippinarum]
MVTLKNVFVFMSFRFSYLVLFDKVLTSLFKMSVPILVRVLFAVFAVIQPTTGQNTPTWNTGTTFTKTSSDCPEITDLSATSQSGDTVVYSVESQTPNAGFTIGVNFASDPILTCVASSVSQSSYVVVVRAKYQSDPGDSDLTITITFTDQSHATGPIWNTGTSHTFDKAVTTLSATSTDSSTVTNRANNNVSTDITLTITVTGLSVKVTDTDCIKDTANQCKDIPNAECDNAATGAKCKCSDGYAADRNTGTSCVKTVSGTTCTAGGKECESIKNSQCVSTKCQCNDGFEMNVDVCAAVSSAISLHFGSLTLFFFVSTMVRHLF